MGHWDGIVPYYSNPPKKEFEQLERRKNIIALRTILHFLFVIIGGYYKLRMLCFVCWAGCYYQS
jgi:hypothetical protein